jgi:hypothetical protein
MEVSKICGTCANYRDTALHGIICDVTKRPVGYLQQKDCWTSLVVNATTGEDILPKPSKEPDPKPEPRPEKKTRKGGRKAEFPKYTDEKTGLVMKFCRACRTYKPVTEFNLNAANSDGYGTRCKQCHSAYMAEYLKRRKEQKEVEAMAEEAAKVATESADRLPETHAPAGGIVFPKEIEKTVPRVVFEDMRGKRRPVEVALSAATDQQLFEELRRRDFHGTLSKGQYTI